MYQHYQCVSQLMLSVSSSNITKTVMPQFFEHYSTKIEKEIFAIIQGDVKNLWANFFQFTLFFMGKQLPCSQGWMGQRILQFKGSNLHVEAGIQQCKLRQLPHSKSNKYIAVK